MNYRENRELWVQRVENYQTSGLTQADWCQKYQVKISTLRYWLRKLKDDDTSDGTPEWVELKVTDKAPAPPSDATIKIHVGTFQVEIREGFNRLALLDVLKTLSTLC